MDWDDIGESFLGTLLAGIVLVLVVIPLAGRLAGRDRGRGWRLFG
jgi:hypothetical protein